MRKLILFFLFTPAFILEAQEDYGRHFKDYVVNSLPSQSRRFAASDYEAKWFLYLQTRIDQRNQLLAESLTIIDSAYKEVIAFEGTYDSLLEQSTSLVDTLGLDLQRHKHSRSIMQSLDDIDFLLERQDRIVREIDSAWTREKFLQIGMGHGGKERLLESIFNLGNKLGEYSRLNYSVYFTYSGDSTRFNYRGYEDEIAGVLLNLAYHYPAAAPYLYAAYFLYQIYLFNENERQQELLREGLQLIDSQVIQPEEMYQLSKKMYEKQLMLRDSVLIMGNQLADSIKKYTGITKDLSTKRFQVASQRLTRSKLKYIQDNYSINNEVRKNL